MAVTITLDESLSRHLRSEAAARRVSLEEAARQLLRSALRRLQDGRRWERRNQRRLLLIRKSVHEALTPQEAAELEDLQGELDSQSDAFDDALLAELATMEQAAG
jgi:plasmid stability protein